MRYRRIEKICIAACFLFLLMCAGYRHVVLAQDIKIAGTFFGEPIPIGNYNFVLKTVLSFNSPLGSIPRSREQLERRVWDDLLLSYEANRRQISLSNEEFEEKIRATLKGENASFDRKSDPEAYAQWVKDRLGGSIEQFENQMRHLAQIKKLQTQVLDSIDPIVTEDETLQEFLNENNSLSVELAEFTGLEDAQNFYTLAVADAAYWGQYAKEDEQREPGERQFRKPGFVALEFLMEMWGFKKKDVYEMVKMKKGDIYPPSPIYEGYGVFKILDVRLADESEFPKRKESYFDQLRTRKKYDGFKRWFENLQENADIQVFIEPPAELLF